MDALIKAEWMRQEAEARHIAVTDAELQEAVDQGREDRLPQPGKLAEGRLDASVDLN